MFFRLSLNNTAENSAELAVSRASVHLLPEWLQLLLIAIAIAFPFSSRGAFAQPSPDTSDAAGDDESEEDLPLIEQTAYDILTVLDADGKETDFKVYDVKLSRLRYVPRPEERDPNAELQFRLFIRPDDVIAMPWRAVVNLRLYEHLVLEEFQQFIDNEEFAKAYDNLDFLYRWEPMTPDLKARLQKAREDYLLADGQRSFRQGDYDQTLAVYEELHKQLAQRNANLSTVYNGIVPRGISASVDKIAQVYFEKSDFIPLRKFIGRIGEKYKEEQKPIVDKWYGKILELADERKAVVDEGIAEDDGRKAHKAVASLLDLEPNYPGGRALARKVAELFPLALVGVSHRAVGANPRSIHNWANRRVGRLTRRMLFEFDGQGSEGGQYEFRLGARELSEDGRNLTLTLTSGTEYRSGRQVAERLLGMADPRSATYFPPWARLVGEMRVDDVNTIVIDLQNLHVLPEAFLQVFLLPPGTPESEREDGPFATAQKTKEEHSFIANPKYNQQSSIRKLEVTEIYFRDSEEQLRALQKGEIDVIDRVFPADVDRLRNDERIVVQRYELPTVHMLVPNTERPFLGNKVFRRALVFGINRESILRDLLLTGRKDPGCQVVSGPFPKGGAQGSAIGYAYAPDVEPREYLARFGATLKTLAIRQEEKLAANLNKPKPTLGKMVLAHSEDEVARIACGAIARHLQVIGIPIELKELPAGATDDPKRDYDLLYVETAVWEPLVDARRMLAADGLVGDPDSYVNLALRRLDSARGWRIARQRLYDLHRTAYFNVPVVPLYEMTNYFAYRRRIRGIGTEPLTLYQNVDSWQNIPE